MDVLLLVTSLPFCVVLMYISMWKKDLAGRQGCDKKVVYVASTTLLQLWN
jgi:hypothetical protein